MEFVGALLGENNNIVINTFLVKARTSQPKGSNGGPGPGQVQVFTKILMSHLKYVLSVSVPLDILRGLAARVQNNEEPTSRTVLRAFGKVGVGQSCRVCVLSLHDRGF